MADPGLTEDEFVDAFARHGRTLWVLAAAWVGREDAMDLVQETARVAWQRRAAFARGTDVRAWLSQIARHLGANARRRRTPVATDPALLEPEAPPRQPLHELAASAIDPEGLGLGDEIAQALGALPEPQRAALLLHAVLGHTFAEIGTLLDMPENTAASHVRRARLQLRERLAAAPPAPHTP